MRSWGLLLPLDSVQLPESMRKGDRKFLASLGAVLAKAAKYHGLSGNPTVTGRKGAGLRCWACRSLTEGTASAHGGERGAKSAKPWRAGHCPAWAAFDWLLRNLEQTLPRPGSLTPVLEA